MKTTSAHDALWEMLGALHRDFNQAFENLQEEDTPYNRRAYVRTAFASVEGITFSLKQEALRHKERGHFSQAETALLLEESYTLDKGKATVQGKFLRLEDNFPFAVEMWSRAMKSPFVLKKEKEWEAFKNAIWVRNRIAHPKRPEHLEISDHELEEVGTAYGWVVGSIIYSLSEGVSAVRSELEEVAKEHGIALKTQRLCTAEEKETGA
jgi:hypothetical protein